MRMWCALALGCLLAGGGEDRDGDGLDDAFEQRLLERFAPVLFLSAGECDAAPSEFAPGERTPRALARNGTMYGRATRHPGGRYIELHFYHLWNNDCGRMGHALVAEHVSALVEGEKAVYWFAAAHQDTVCDRGHGAGAKELHAVEKGPVVWVSQGKHASYLSKQSCAYGCGSDRCGELTRLKPARMVNLGETGAPLNGAVWVEHPSWNLAKKFRTDFPAETLAQLEHPKKQGIVWLNGSLAPAQALVLAGNATGDGLATGNRHTGEALTTAENHTGRALATSAGKVKGSLKKAHRAVRGFLRGER